MATINLGRIKPVNKGTWNSGTTYAIDDFVQYTDGDITSTFIAVQAGSNQTPSTGGTLNSSYWGLMAKGQPQSFNSNGLKNDISTLALRQASNENKTGYNTETSFVDVFQDNSNVANLVSAGFNSAEYMQVQGSTDTSVTLQASNYTTYIDVNNLSFIRDGSGADRYNPTITPNTMYYGASTGIGSQNQVVQDSQEATLLGYLFAQNGSTTQYMIDTNNSENRFNLSLKAGKTFAPTSFNFRWQNGSGSFSNQNLYGVDSSYNATELYSDTAVTNNVDNTNSFSNSTFFPNLTIRTKHSSTNGFMWDYLRIGGTVREVGQGAGDGSFTNNAITASSTISSMGAVITYEDNAGTNALNTDLVLKLSADNGSNYSTATLIAMPDFSTGIKMAKVNDLAVTSGTQLLYKLEIKNQAIGSKEARIRGVALQF
jgi:hypothetical protein